MKENQSKLDNEELETHISAALIDLGVPIKLKGFKFLVRMISIVYNEPSEAEFFTKILYPRVAKEFSTRTTALEHACRRAMMCAYELPKIRSFSGYTEKSGSHLTLGSFVLLTAEKIRNGDF